MLRQKCPAHPGKFTSVPAQHSTAQHAPICSGASSGGSGLPMPATARLAVGPSANSTLAELSLIHSTNLGPGARRGAQGRAGGGVAGCGRRGGCVKLLQGRLGGAWP